MRIVSNYVLLKTKIVNEKEIQIYFTIKSLKKLNTMAFNPSVLSIAC